MISWLARRLGKTAPKGWTKLACTSPPGVRKLPAGRQAAFAKGTIMFCTSLLRRSGRQLRQLHTMPEHPHKVTVAALLHQRPFQRVEIPSMVSSITMMPSKWQATLRGCDHALYSAEGNPTPLHIRASAPEQYDADYKHLCTLCDFFHVQGPPHGATFFTTDLGGACKLRWERHTEAQTYTFTRPAVAGEKADPFAESNVALSVI